MVKLITENFIQQKAKHKTMDSIPDEYDQL